MSRRRRTTRRRERISRASCGATRTTTKRISASPWRPSASAANLRECSGLTRPSEKAPTGVSAIPASQLPVGAAGQARRALARLGEMADRGDFDEFLDDKAAYRR